MSMFNPEIHHRHSTRLQGYDYSRPGHYFITINLDNIRCMLAVWKNGLLQLSTIGEIVKKYWTEIPGHYPNVAIDEFVVMPEHFHGILQIRDDGHGPNCRGVQLIDGNDHPNRRGVQLNALTVSQYYSQLSPVGRSLSVIIRNYKSTVKRWCNENGFPKFKWQRNFFEHIIRDENALYKIRSYIHNNPAALRDCFPGLSYVK